MDKSSSRPKKRQGPPRLAKALTLAAMSLGYGVVQLDVTIVNVRLNSIGRSYGGAVDTLQWVVSAYTITFATLILTAGALGDRIGVKVALATSASLLTVAGLAILVGLKTPKGDTGAVSRPMKSR